MVGFGRGIYLLKKNIKVSETTTTKIKVPTIYGCRAKLISSYPKGVFLTPHNGFIKKLDFCKDKMVVKNNKAVKRKITFVRPTLLNKGTSLVKITGLKYWNSK